MRQLLQRLRLVLPIVLVLGTQAVSACESGMIRAVLRDAHPQARASDDGRALVTEGDGMRADLSQVHCRRWPAQPHLLLLAVYWQSPAAIASNGEGHGDLEVLVADAVTAVVQARHRAVGRLEADAIRIDGVALDTASYDLAPSIHAFGVRIDRSNSSRVNPFSRQELDLYVLTGTALRPVMQGLEVEGYWAEWDGVCDGENSSSRSTVAVEPASVSAANPAGWADLVVRTAGTHSRASEVGGECMDSPVNASRKTARLRYDGHQYPVADRW